jgi:plasmid stability protein
MAMPDLLVRDLDKATIDRLKRRAEAKRRSLQQEVHEILTKAVPLTGVERAFAFDRIRAMQSKPAKLLSEDLLREDRARR